MHSFFMCCAHTGQLHQLDATMPSARVGATQTNYKIAKKLEVVSDVVDGGKSISTVSRERRIDWRSIARWVNQRHALQTADKASKRLPGGGRQVQYPDLDIYLKNKVMRLCKDVKAPVNGCSALAGNLGYAEILSGVSWTQIVHGSAWQKRSRRMVATSADGKSATAFAIGRQQNAHKRVLTRLFFSEEK